VASDGSGELLKQGIYLPLGIDPQTYEPQTMTLGPGDAWLLYSDGLSEMTTPGGTMLGNAGVLDLCRQMLKPTARETISHLLSWVEENAADREQVDDQTLVLVRRS
jgi:sigma-B regulation protein RsbU (phosphoserine phosphatase)